MKNVIPFKIKRGKWGGIYAVFPNCSKAEGWDWLFYGILRRRVTSFDGFENSYCLKEGKFKHAKH